MSLNYNATAQMSSDAMNSDCGFSYFSVFHILAFCAFHMMRGICMLAMPTIHAWSAKLAMSLVYVILRLLSQSEPVACVRQAHEGNYLHKQTSRHRNARPTARPFSMPAETVCAKIRRVFAKCFHRNIPRQKRIPSAARKAGRQRVKGPRQHWIFFLAPTAEINST